VHTVRVVIANNPRLMRDLVLEMISGQPDFEVVGETEEESEVAELVDRTKPDCLIVTLRRPELQHGFCGSLIGRYPQMRILAVAAGTGNSVFYWAFVDVRSKTVATSEEGLLSALRNPSTLLDTWTAHAVHD
jgi:chemotaxis response regulator CheB